ncbi:MAG: GNAT family N-acetyltransferase [Spirochaetaceae bacterium]
MIIKKMNDLDIIACSEIHKAVFSRQTMSLEWIKGNYLAYPRMQYYVAEDQGEILGYIHWTQKSGFRPEVVLELEQIAVSPRHQKKGIGEALITQSLLEVKRQLSTRGAQIKHIIVTTRADNYAQKLYEKTLGVKVDATLKDLYSADEVIMIKRDVSKT